MENPLHWTKIERLINEALMEHREQVGRGDYGCSDVRSVYTKLLDAGVLREQDTADFFVNGEERSLYSPGVRASYETLVSLRLGRWPTDSDPVHTIVWSTGGSNGQSGTVAPGQSVRIFSGMRFTIVVTGDA